MATFQPHCRELSALTDHVDRRHRDSGTPDATKGEFHPRRELRHWHDLVERDVQIIRWFVQDEMGLKFEVSPLKYALDIYSQVDPNIVAPAFEDTPVKRSQHGLHFFAQFERLA